MLLAGGRRTLAVLVIALIAVAYAAAPRPRAATPSGMLLGHVPSSSASLNGAVVVGPGGASTGYDTKLVVITQGSSLSFVNLDELAHTVTSVARDAHGRPLFSGNALPGTTATVTGANRLAPGTYDFYCQYHPNMTGQLIVEGKSGTGVKPGKPHFRSRLRVPKVLTGKHITLRAKRTKVRLLPHGPKTAMWTFDGSYPGPTISRPDGHRTTVTVVNDLSKGVGPITLHLHGDHHASVNDGLPDSHLVRPGHRRKYVYPLRNGGKPERAAFDFYHDHRMGHAGRDIWNGLEGMFLTHDKHESRLPLPKGRYDVPLAVADRSFDNDDQLTEPFHHKGDGDSGTADKVIGPYTPPGDATVGDDILVNGTLTPHFNVTTHRYRLRLLNASNFQSYDFVLSNGRSFTQIGTGDGLLPHPVVRKDIELGPAQRADVVVSFHGEKGKRVRLESEPSTDPNPGAIGSPTADVMQFRVTRKVRDHTRVPHQLEKAPPLHAPSTPSAVWTFGLGGNLARGTFWSVNNQAYDPHRVDQRVPLGSTQTWLLVNDSPLTHYIHIHEEEWHTVAVDGQPPPAYLRGLEDTWRLDPGQSVEVAAKFTDYTGVFMIHCHMLDHEDHGMMAQFAVTKRGSKALPAGYHYQSGSNTPSALAAPTGAGMAMGMHAPVPAPPALMAKLATGPLSAAGQMPGMSMAGNAGDGAAVETGLMRHLVRAGWALSIELPLLGLALLWTRRRRLTGHARRVTSILLLAGVALTHASDWLDKLQTAPYLAVAFGALILGSGGCAVAIGTVRRTRWWDVVGGWVSGLTVAGYLASRSIGLPQIHDHIGHWADPWGTASLVVEIGLVLVAARRWLPLPTLSATIATPTPLEAP